MTTSYYDYRYSPPVSPKSQPHGCKRKASTQEDELENQSLISNSLKKLRLHNVRPPSAVDRPHQDAYHHNAIPLDSVLGVNAGPAKSHTPPVHVDAGDNNDFMPVDDSKDRIWVHDLHAEIAEIEAEEARQRNALHIVDTGQDYSKIPEHLLKPSARADDPAANMQMILYRDPVSISLPEEEDAVRKTIIDARRRARERQAETHEHEADPRLTSAHALPQLYNDHHMMSHYDDGMDMDID